AACGCATGSPRARRAPGSRRSFPRTRRSRWPTSSSRTPARRSCSGRRSRECWTRCAPAGNEASRGRIRPRYGFGRFRFLDHVLVTGYPKLLARRMALRLHAGGARVSLLAQDKHAEGARSFAQGAMDVLVGDIGGMHLGLSTAEYRDLRDTVTDVLHAAEWSYLGAPREEMARVNVDGTRAVLELAGDCRQLRRF